MTLDEYQEQALSFAVDNVAANPIQYGLLNISSETGELLDKYAKALRKGEEVDTELVQAELGDILWCLALLARSTGSSLDAVAQYNIDKLSGRKERGTLVGEGDVR